MSSKIRTFVLNRWPALLGGGAALGIAAVALFWRLGTLLPGYSDGEVAAYHRALDLPGMLSDPINLPFTALSRLLLEINTGSLFLVRVAAVLCGFAAVWLFYWLIQHWHSHRIAFLATVLFACVTAFLLTAREGTPAVLLFGLFGLVAYGVWLKKHISIKWSLPLGLILACLLLYVPGMIWFLLAGVIWQWNTIAQKLWRTPLWLTLLTILPVFAVLFPLGWGIAHNPHLIETIIGLPEQFPGPSDIVHNFLSIPRDLFFTHASSMPGSGLHGLMVLDVLAVALFIFGVYIYFKYFRLSRSLFLLGIAVIAVILISLGGMSVTVLLPFVFVVVAGGLAYFLGEWLMVFPRNVFARSTGIAILSLLIIFSCTYNLRRYFVALPLSDYARTTYTHTRP